MNIRNPENRTSWPTIKDDSKLTSQAKSKDAKTGKAASPQKHAFFTVAELACRWALSERQVRRFIDEGRIPAHHFGKAVRVSAANVALFEAECAESV